MTVDVSGFVFGPDDVHMMRADSIMAFHLRKSGGDERVRIITYKLVKISDNTDEFGKLGKVSENNRLELETLSYYPNPAPNGIFKLKFRTPSEGELSIKIYNLDGREIFSRYFERYSGLFSETIDLSGQAEGIYLMEIEMEGKRLTRKIAVNE